MAVKRTRLAAGTGLSLGAALGMAAPAQAVDYQVTNLNDTGPGSLRNAMFDADATASVDRILFQSTLSGTLAPVTALPIIEEPVEIVGPGPDVVTITGNGGANGGFFFGPGVPDAPMAVSGLTLTGATQGGGGGGIFNNGASLTLSNVAVTNNTTTAAGAGIFSIDGSLVLRDSVVSGNRVLGQAGGGVWSFDNSLTIERSTISGNTASDRGAGVYHAGASPLSISSSTIANNSTPNVAGGGGLGVNGTVGPRTITNTLIGDNSAPSGPDVRTVTGTLAAAFSLVENPAGATITGTTNVTGQDAKLLGLTDNGGPTATHALATGSPALDKGSATGLDQRGLARPFDLKGIPLATGGNSADIGAYERVLCGKIEVRTIGTAGPDTLRGTKGKDGISGLGGKDTLVGLAGNDGLCGGPGKDKLKGGAGKDGLFGQGGSDTLIGGKGKDSLKGGKGKDKERP
jgi:Ca2+-binding RTX toxin-like protein